MKNPAAILLALALGLPCLSTSCNDAEDSSPVASQTPAEKLAALDAAIDSLQARPEHGASEVTVQHLLVGINGPTLAHVTRTAGDAEHLTAELYARAKSGEDFDTLVKNYSDDRHPGIYTLLASGTSDLARGIALRSEMVQGFGDTAWRLEVGEIGVTEYDPPPWAMGTGKAEFGFHIVKRLR